MPTPIAGTSPTLYQLANTDCVGDSLPYINNNTVALNTIINSNVNTLTTLINSVSALFATAPSVAKAWVNVDATRNSSGVSDNNNTNRYIRSNRNVSSVLRTAQGRYTLTFATPMADANYSVCITGNGPVNVQHCNPYIRALTNTTLTFGFWNSANSANSEDPSIICIQVFGN